MKNKKSYLIIITAIFLFLSIYLLFGSPQLLSKSESPEFCGSCHIMHTEYEDWFYSGSHSKIKCVDCHLPNDNLINHFIWKGIDGMKDVFFFYTGLHGNELVPTAHTTKTVKENCLRCHQQMVSLITTDDRDCWDCHRRTVHDKRGMVMVNPPSE